MCECGRRTSGWIGIITEIHACDETLLHGEHVKDLAVRKNTTLKAPDELVHPNAGLVFPSSSVVASGSTWDRTHPIVESNSRGSLVVRLSRRPLKPSERLTSCVISANALSMSRLLNAESVSMAIGLPSVAVYNSSDVKTRI
jgi:hypothetical protein